LKEQRVLNIASKRNLSFAVALFQEALLLALLNYGKLFCGIRYRHSGDFHFEADLEKRKA
jgi:hypothetical protein